MLFVSKMKPCCSQITSTEVQYLAPRCFWDIKMSRALTLHLVVTSKKEPVEPMSEDL